jgi:DnaJ-class molecular chaperone
MFSLTIACEDCWGSGLIVPDGVPAGSRPVPCPGCDGSGSFDVIILDES